MRCSLNLRVQVMILAAAVAGLRALRQRIAVRTSRKPKLSDAQVKALIEAGRR